MAHGLVGPRSIGQGQSLHRLGRLVQLTSCFFPLLAPWAQTKASCPSDPSSASPSQHTLGTSRVSMPKTTIKEYDAPSPYDEASEAASAEPLQRGAEKAYLRRAHKMTEIWAVTEGTEPGRSSSINDLDGIQEYRFYPQYEAANCHHHSVLGQEQFTQLSSCNLIDQFSTIEP